MEATGVETAVADRFSLWPLALGFLATHFVAVIFDYVLDDSPGAWLAFLFYGLPALVIVGICWLAFASAALLQRRWRRGVSWLCGPLAGVALVVGMAFMGFPPHFHAVYGEYEANVAIESGDLIGGRLPRNAARLVAEWTIRHRAELEANWQRTQFGHAPEKIAGLDADEGR